MIRSPGPKPGSNTARTIDDLQVIGILQRNIKQVANMLRQHFPPWSLFQAPGVASPNTTGNRAVALTGNAPAHDSIDLAMTNGSVTWTFSREFSTPPICTATAIGPYPGGAVQEIFIAKHGTPTTKSVVFQSSAGDDVRVLHMTATVTPT